MEISERGVCEGTPKPARHTGRDAEVTVAQLAEMKRIVEQRGGAHMLL